MDWQQWGICLKYAGSQRASFTLASKSLRLGSKLRVASVFQLFREHHGE